MPKKQRNPHLGSSFESWLDEEGIRDEVMASIIPNSDDRAPIVEARNGGLIALIKESLAPYVGMIKGAFVFGSVAKGIDNAHSDVDLMVIGDDLNYSDLYTAAQDAERKIGRRVNALFLSSEEWRRKVSDDGSVFSKIIRAPKLFIIGSEKDLESWASKSSTIS